MTGVLTEGLCIKQFLNLTGCPENDRGYFSYYMDLFPLSTTIFELQEDFPLYPFTIWIYFLYL